MQRGGERNKKQTEERERGRDGREENIMRELRNTRERDQCR